MIKLGSHVSISKGLIGAAKEAYSYGANTFMIYTGAPQNTRRKKIEDMKIEEGKKFIQDNNMFEPVVHAPYIINMASCKEDTYSLAISFLKIEIERAIAFGAKYIVVHPGAYTTSSLDEGIEKIINALNEIIYKDMDIIICLETMAGKGTEVGKTFEELKKIIDGVKLKEKIGVCLDTCHVHDGGYDIINDMDGVFNEFDKLIGLDKLKVLHINGSLNEKGAKKDRHANLWADDTFVKGPNCIPKETLYNIVNSNYCKGKIFILETPWLDKKTNLYKEEIAFLCEKKI